MPDDPLFSPFEVDEQVSEGDRIIADVDPASDAPRRAQALEATRLEAYGNVPVNKEQNQEDSPGSFGKIQEGDDGGGLGIFKGTGVSGGRERRIADVNSATVTDRRDLNPVGIGRDRRSGRFTPEDTEAAPRSPSDRDPDDGEFVTPDPRPVTDIGRQEDDGLFDLF